MDMGSSDLARVRQTMEALSDFLESTKRTVEQLCVVHTQASMEASKQRKPDAPSAFGMPPASGKWYSHSSADDGTEKADQTQSRSFSYTSTSLDERLSQGKVAPSGKAALVAYRTLSEPEMGHAVGVFLEDVKKTVDVWCSRYHLLADGKISFDAMPQPLHTNMQVMDQLDFDADRQNFSVRDNEILHPCAQNGKAVGMPFTKQVLKRPLTTSRLNRNRARNSALSVQGMMGTMKTAQNIELSQQDIVETQEPTPRESQVENKKMNINHKSAMEGQGGYNIQTCEDVDVDVDVGKASANDRELGENSVVEGTIVKFGSPDELEKKLLDDVKPPLETDELTIRQYQYKVEVVESPEWLPKGWITELKTRGAGGSAGCKDKYYYDPVSKRRCRSQKEVFCLLQTGKLGRYKRRTKVQPANKLLGIDLEQQVSNSNEMQAANQQEVSGVRTSGLSQAYAQGNMPSPLCVLPGMGPRGVVGSTFLPYCPGQTSDSSYESMANISRPAMDQYRFLDPRSSKSNGDRNFASRPWLFSNAEGCTRPLFAMDKIGKGAGRRCGTEGAPKRARKSSKKSAS